MNSVWVIARFRKGLSEHTEIFVTWESVNRELFSPETELIEAVALEPPRGKTYQDRKNDLQEKAISLSHLVPNIILTHGEITYMHDYFEKYGRIYGFLKEFRENGII